MQTLVYPSGIKNSTRVKFGYTIKQSIKNFQWFKIKVFPVNKNKIIYQQIVNWR